MFNQYPYLNLNDLNLDYILKAIKEMRYEVTNFVSINAIKYADPIQWNITSQYEKNTIVIDPVTGTAYISVAPVPAGVALTRPEYWTVVFDLGSFVTRAAQNFTSHWESDTTTTATFSTPAGAWLVWGDVLYKALVNITAGDAYVVDSNIEHITIEDVINAIAQDIADEVQARTDADTALQGAIDDEAQARLDGDAALQIVDNTIIANIGNLDDLTTDDKSSIVGAINELNRSDIVFNVVDYGAKGDGVTDDTQSIQNAVDAAFDAGGGIVFIPPTGKPYIISAPIDVKAGVSVCGTANKYYAGMNVADDVWTAKGTWLKATTTAFTLSGHGCRLSGVNIFYSQPAPSGAFTPTTYPFAVIITATLFTVTDVMIVGATHGIQVNYNSVSGGGAYSRFEHLYLGCFDVAMQMLNVNDVIDFNDIQIRPLWYMTNSNVVAYLETHLIGLDCYYFDNPAINDIQFFNCYIAMKLTNGTCLGNTHSLYNAIITNAQFNLVNYGIMASAADVKANIVISNSLFQSDTETGNINDVLSLDSPDINMQMSNCRVNACNRFAVIGGALNIDNCYIAYGNNGISECFSISTNAVIATDNNKIVKLNANAGVIFSGANSYNGVITRKLTLAPWSGLYDVADITSDGSYKIMSSELFIFPTLDGFNQIRVQFIADITTTVSGGVMRAYCNGFTEAKAEANLPSTDGVSISGDTGWLDMTSSGEIGSVLVETNAGVVWRPKSLVISFR